MNKIDILSRIQETGVVAVVRAENEKKAVEISEACRAGGVDAVEITFTVPGAHRVIEALVHNFGDDLLVGAGTVLDPETARLAILSGACYIVSPSFDEETARLCNRYQIPYMPGCMTITEMVKAMEAGADILKVFPGSVYGPDFIKAVKAPLPQAVIMPTGGVNLDNVAEWIENGCVAVGVGGNLTKGSCEEITTAAKAYRERVVKAREGVCLK